MAGEEGFEPSNAGIKIRCLNQLGDSPAEKPARSRGALRRAEPVRASCERRERMARERPGDEAVHRRRPRVDRARALRASVANGANTQLPDPVIRACGERCAAPRAPRDVRKLARRRPAAGRSGHNPRKRRPFSPTASFVSIPAPRRSTRSTRATRRHDQARPSSGGSDTGVRRSPMPRASAGSPPRKNGTSAPSASADRSELARAAGRDPTAG